MGSKFYFDNRGFSKYGNKKVVVDGITFDSKREANRYSELKLLERGKQISDLRLQVPFELIPKQMDFNGKILEGKISYVADFVYTDKDGNYVVEDAKGYRTDVYRIKKKLMLYFHNIIIKEV